MPAFQGCCSHDHDCEAADCGPAYSLYKYIDMPRVHCLNEATDGSCRKVFKPWSQRTEPTSEPLQSNDDDPELLLHVPFDGAVKLKAICIIGGQNGTAPSKLRVYINRDDLDFSTVSSLPPVQEWDLQDNTAGVIEYPTQVAKFNGVHSIDLHIPSCFSGDMTEVHFVGFKGEWSDRKRRPVEAVYEAQPMPDSNAVSEQMKPHMGLGM